MAKTDGRSITVRLSGNHSYNPAFTYGLPTQKKVEEYLEAEGHLIHDTAQKVGYVYVAQVPTGDESGNFFLPAEKEETGYANLMSILREKEISGFFLNFLENQKGDFYGISSHTGQYPLGASGNSYSFFRQEYKKDENGNVLFQGSLEPVLLSTKSGWVRDYNIQNDKTYRYLVYPSSGDVSYAQQYATTEIGEEGKEQVDIHWNYWSLTELSPATIPKGSNRMFNKAYTIDDKAKVWTFKYNMQAGEQTQNLTRNEQKSLGRFPRFTHNEHNYLSGSVSCLLGSEIIPYTDGYVERIRDGFNKPLSTNERAYMLQEWRKFVFSKKPKLLKDTKGQSMIVVLTGSSNTPFNDYKNQPDTISFNWTQVDTTENVIITN